MIRLVDILNEAGKKDTIVGDYTIYYVSNPKSAIGMPSGYNWAVGETKKNGGVDFEDAFRRKSEAIAYAEKWTKRLKK